MAINFPPTISKGMISEMMTENVNRYINCKIMSNEELNKSAFMYSCLFV